jgi:hypothetical protein
VGVPPAAPGASCRHPSRKASPRWWCRSPSRDHRGPGRPCGRPRGRRARPPGIEARHPRSARPRKKAPGPAGKRHQVPAPEGRHLVRQPSPPGDPKCSVRHASPETPRRRRFPARHIDLDRACEARPDRHGRPAPSVPRACRAEPAASTAARRASWPARRCGRSLTTRSTTRATSPRTWRTWFVPRAGERCPASRHRLRRR